MNVLMTRNIFVITMIVGTFLPTATEAGVITFSGNSIDLQGTGFGNTLTSLIVHNNGSEFGSVLWNGKADVTTDDATNQSSTRTAAVLSGAGIDASNFSLVFNIAEAKGQGTDVTLFDFALRFQDASGASLFPDVVYDAPVAGTTLEQIDNGVGGAGWLFTVSLAPAEAASFFGTGTNRVGMVIASGQAIQDSSGGPDGFFFAPVPEPGSAGLLAVGVLVLGLTPVARRLRQRG